MNLSPAALPLYEQLRAEVLNGQARPQGLAAIVYHGMLRGLAVILADVAPLAPSPRSTIPLPEEISLDRELLRLIANMVLQTQSQVMHAY
jgi:hypothetical protein